MTSIFQYYGFFLLPAMLLFVRNVALKLPKHNNSLLRSKDITIFLSLIILILAVGFFKTHYIYRPILNFFDIQFSGNVWVLWFACSYILYVSYLILVTLLGERNYIKEIFSSSIAWIVLGLSLIAIIVPLIYGEIPY